MAHALSDGEQEVQEDIFFEVIKTEKREYKCYAIDTIQKGQTIVVELPLLNLGKIEYNEPDFKYWIAFQKELTKLTDDEKSEFVDLLPGDALKDIEWKKNKKLASIKEYMKNECSDINIKRERKETIMDLFKASVIYERFGHRDGEGFCLQIARFNHSCRANACMTFNQDFKCRQIFATKKIKKGEEITINILPTYNKGEEGTVCIFFRHFLIEGPNLCTICSYLLLDFISGLLNYISRVHKSELRLKT